VNGKARAKIFSLHAKLIALAARGGDDPSANPALFEAIAKARKDNVPNDNTERAIARGSGKDKDASEIVEMIYEGYAS
jgi:transcriptional/translational regulatory protein YebC/TACO1